MSLKSAGNKPGSLSELVALTPALLDITASGG